MTFKAYQFLQMLKQLRDSPSIITRGQEVREIENYRLNVDYPFMSLKSRRLSLSYIRAEFLWYLRANPYDTMITEHAQIWTDLQQPDGAFLSNYGQYWFGEQNGFQWVVDELSRDPNSRRAIIPMIRPVHLYADNKDVVCTMAISFRIRDDRLNMTVHMRSNDAIWGAGNDIPCFWFLREMIAVKLGIEVGDYVHLADSMHVYSRHYDTLNRLCDEGADGYYEVTYPAITDIEDLISFRFESPFGLWLTNRG